LTILQLQSGVSAADDLRRVDEKFYFVAVTLACNKVALKICFRLNLGPGLIKKKLLKIQ